MLLRCLFTFTVGLGVLAAQQSELPPGAASGSLRHHSGVAREGDTVVGVGADYRAVIDRRGLEFTPAFGDVVPNALPLRLELHSITRGGRQLPLVPADALGVDGTSVRATRGDVDERFDVRPEGVEHSLVFASRPLGSGDLVVGLTVTTELAGAACADGSLRFWREGLGGVSIGHVTGIAADGARVRGGLRLVGERLEYTLPAAFVDEAAYPLTLDPLIGAQFVLGAADDIEGNVAYDPGSDTYLAVWKRRLAATDHDIVGVRLDAAGNVLGGALLFETASSIVASRPCVAPVRVRSAFAVVWQQGSGAFGPFDIRSRSVDGISGALSSAVTVVGTADDEYEPCISGDVSTVDDDVLVAWRSPTGIQAMQLTVPVSLMPAPSSIVSLTTSPFVSKPAFSKSGGLIGQHLVVWEEEPLIGDTQIRGRVVTRNLTLLTSVISLSSSARHKSAPRCDGDGTTFMVVYEREEVSGTGRKDVYARRLGYASGALSLQTGEVAVEATGAQDEAAPDVAWLGSRWCVALQERVSGLDDDVVTWMLRDDCTPCSGRTVLTGLDPQPSYRREFQPRLANRYVGLQAHAEAMLSYTEAQDGPPFAANVLAQRLEAIGSGTAPVTIASGCGPGGVAGSTGGPFVLGNSSFAFRVTGLPPTALPLLSLTLPGPLPPDCGGCVVPNPVVLTFVLPAAGEASSGFVVPCAAHVLGISIDSQWVSFFGGSTPCPLLADFAASDLLRFTVGE